MGDFKKQRPIREQPRKGILNRVKKKSVSSSALVKVMDNLDDYDSFDHF